MRPITAIVVSIIAASITPAIAQSMKEVCAGYQRQYDQCYARFEQIRQNNLAGIATIKDPYERRATERAMQGTVNPEILCAPFKDAMWRIGYP
jgi:hypothetical protein